MGGTDDGWTTACANSRKMMAARGFTNFNDDSEVHHTSDLDYVVVAQEGAATRFVSFMTKQPKLGLKEVRSLEDRMTKMNVETCTIVLNGTVTPPAKGMIEKIRKKGRAVEIFQLDELMFNLPDHELVPVHRLLTPKEREALLKRFSANALPRILPTDPMCRYLGLKRGQVVEISRKNTSGFSKFHRIVT